jgi:hypothetical protein
MREIREPPDNARPVGDIAALTHAARSVNSKGNTNSRSEQKSVADPK